MLHVVLDIPASTKEARTSEGRILPLLSLTPFLETEIFDLAEQLKVDSFPYQVEGTYGRCASVVEAGGHESMREFVHLAAEWRMLFKAREIRERMDRIGGDQAVYEMFMYACGFSHFKQHFKAIARQLPYERVRQLGQDNALLLEAAMLHISGLFPDDLPEGTKALPQIAQIGRASCRERG